MIPLGRAASIDFRGGAADLPMAFESVIEAIAKVVDVSEVTGDKLDLRVRVGAGGCVRLLGGAPAEPKTSPEDTLVLTMVLEATDGLSSDQIKAILGAVRRVPFTATEMATLRGQMPLTGELPMFAPAGCLSSVAPVLTVHHMTDFLMLVEAVQAMGVPPQAITVLDKGYPYRYTDRVDAHLTRQGITVWPWTRTPDALEDHVRRAAELGRRGLLVDDGGYTLPTMLNSRPGLLPHFIGLVEQTISGITRLEPWPQPPLPIFSVAESRMKATVESYGVADAAIRNALKLISEEKLEGRAALVIGHGRIGEQIAEVLRARRMRVAVYDQQLVRLIAAHERGFVTGRSLSTLLREHRPMLIVGSTGRTSVRGEHAAAIGGDCYLVSTTSRNTEFAIAELVEEAAEVSDAGVLGIRLRLRSGAHATIIGDGFPVNFHHAESLPNAYSDLILASLLVGAATLAALNHGFTPGHNVARSDQVLESCGLLDRYYDLFGPKAAR
ncbi:NAD(P)-dependent oxidoreductase [Nonomuraea sp. NPDC052265]|uniref:NAD(P)-dependent oxidoreductase n=1 Tax=Nonomuraea sp. NPDC052265 TaxID=3364374 RepID=UPI0037C9AAFE